MSLPLDQTGSHGVVVATAHCFFLELSKLNDPGSRQPVLDLCFIKGTNDYVQEKCLLLKSLFLAYNNISSYNEDKNASQLILSQKSQVLYFLAQIEVVFLEIKLWRSACLLHMLPQFSRKPFTSRYNIFNLIIIFN